ncbi:UDP-glucose 4-epimerase GalE [Aquicoccus sp. G2-2]|uniref:UDP-glucose 4-epimerase GalE n=1 Tax=Aquicoccus sp. G2-2 TaxID=3092120 RepID=UPI002ADFA944|nr:UDP-glucose 4-epimerase GalE [Aquicoccus sp. G2-2]MEA1114607.1 UDP-glucose 4-epimerase GalE [Aquicoccus sp. G2-2]
MNLELDRGEQDWQRVAQIVNQQTVTASNVENRERRSRVRHFVDLGRQNGQNLQVRAAQDRRHLGKGIWVRGHYVIRNMQKREKNTKSDGKYYGAKVRIQAKLLKFSKDGSNPVWIISGVFWMRRILVTGGAGYIGSHMVLRLRDAGETPVVMDDLSTGNAWLLPDDVPLIEADVGDFEAVSACIREHGIKDVLHFAGSIIVPESVADPLKYYHNNTCISRNLTEACVAGGVENFIFSSTAAVYGLTGDKPVDETAACAPLSPYGASKLMTEWMLRDVAATGALRYGVLRYFNVAGADPDLRTGHCKPEATHLIKVACQAALGQRDSVQVYGTDYPTSDGTGVRDYVHVSDLVDAHALLLEALRAGGDNATLNCGYGRGSSVRDVINVMKSVSNSDFAVEDCPRRAGDAASVVANAAQLRQRLNWTPRFDDLQTMIEHAYRWECKLHDGNCG